jgi:hypothetical protein
LTKAEREEILTETFDNYRARTGPDALKDIGGAPVARTAASVLNDLSDDALHELVARRRTITASSRNGLSRRIS